MGSKWALGILGKLWVVVYKTFKIRNLKLLLLYFSIKFPKVPGVLKSPKVEDGSKKDSEWGFQGFRGRKYLNEPMNRVKRRAKSTVDIFHGPRYNLVDEAVPLDNISTSSDHIYAEIEDEPPRVPPRDTPRVPIRPDTPIHNEAPDYPPYSSRDVPLRRYKSERVALNKDGNIVISHICWT